MHDLIVVEKHEHWQRLKAMVLDSVSSPITRRVYNMALDEFIAWFKEAPHPGFSKATVSAWRVSLEARGLGSSSIIIRMSAIRKLAAEAADNGLLDPELAAGISRVKSVKSVGIPNRQLAIAPAGPGTPLCAGCLYGEGSARPRHSRCSSRLRPPKIGSGGADV